MRHQLRPAIAILLAAIAGFSLLRFFSAGSQSGDGGPAAVAPTAGNPAQAPSRPGRVAALGYLEPAGNLRVLAPPAQIADGVPRIQSLVVEEGEAVRQGQILATFDTIDRVNSQRQLLLARISALEAQVALLENETNRFRTLTRDGVFPKAELETKELKLLQLKSDLRLARAELNQNTTELGYARLVSPIAGTVVKIYARAGERPSTRGIMEIGATDRMAAFVQVNEADIRRIRIGQEAEIRSENNSFSSVLTGYVSHITPKIGERKQLTLNPGSDSDSEARTVDVKVLIRADQVASIANLTGAKVIAKFKE